MLSLTCYRISKYNPRLRDKSGVYLATDWTAVTDIGKPFDGILDVARYLRTEDAYVDCAQLLWKKAAQPAVNVVGLEDKGIDLRKAALKVYPELCALLNDPMVSDAQEVNDAELFARIVRLNLREFVWCKLESKTGFFIHFGWDFYMYSGGAELESTEIAAFGKAGLFIESFRSPYL